MGATTCVMGCSKTNKQLHIHNFPSNPKRRAEWCRILGIYPRARYVGICKAHFPDYYIYGNRLSPFATPNPPDSRKSESQVDAIEKDPLAEVDVSTVVKKAPLAEVDVSTVVKEDPLAEVDVSTVVKTDPLYEQEVNITCAKNETKPKPPVQTSSYEVNLRQRKQEPKENAGQTEEFEIRKDSSNDMIIKGRYIQTNEFTVVCYTPPKKWSLQQQVKMLDEKCTQQLRKIQQLNAENQRLYKNLLNYKIILPKLRYLIAYNRYYWTLLKMYKLKEKERIKRIKKRSVKRNNSES